MSCSKTDMFDSNAANEQKKELQEKSYAELFVNNYGSTEGKSWDLATLATSYTLESSNRALTRDGNYNADAVEGEMLVNKATIDWMSTNMKAGKNNVKKGKPFYLQVPKNSFTIVPIFQGTASYYWQLWMHVDGIEQDKLIWSKGEIQYITSQGSTEWKSPGTGKTGMNSAFQIKAPTYEFKNLPKNANMYFYLKVWNSYADYKNQSINPRKLTSLNQMMLALINCQVPSNVPAGNEVSIIGCEDNVNGDFDYEDLVFMMYGNPAPPIKHVDEVIEGKTKRYMMEDLGGDDDFDFNDVVVDVISGRAKVKREYEILENGGWKLIKETTIENLPDIAVIRAAGGILDFTLKIGDTTWRKKVKFPNYQQMLNTGRDGEIDYDKELDTFKVEGWNPDNNNISVTVEGNPNDITFPETGKAPMIIAVDPTTNWMFERTPVPESWFTKTVE